MKKARIKSEEEQVRMICINKSAIEDLARLINEKVKKQKKERACILKCLIKF